MVEFLAGFFFFSFFLFWGNTAPLTHGARVPFAGVSAGEVLAVPAPPMSALLPRTPKDTQICFQSSAAADRLRTATALVGPLFLSGKSGTTTDHPLYLKLLFSTYCVPVTTPIISHTLTHFTFLTTLWSKRCYCSIYS